MRLRPDLRSFRLGAFLIFAGCLAPAHSAWPQASLRQKIGQMVMVTVTGDSLERSSPSLDTAKTDLADQLVGGFVMFNWSGNLNGPDQIAHLCAELQERSAVPLLLAIDQEGGQVARLKASNGFAATPSAYTMGTVVHQEAYTRSVAAQMAEWFVQTGLTMNLAPVVDVNVNPASPAIGARERSFSADADTVTDHARWFIEEFRKRGIITTLKHYPGHGSAVGDSHSGFTDVTSTWSAMELLPYSSLVAAGAVDAVMTAHVFNATLDSLHPATLSYNTVQGLLRDQLGYHGVIVSDAMGMSAISQFYGIDQAAALAVQAGVDILLYTSNLDSTGNSLARRIVGVIERQISEGSISESRIDQSYQRIMALKDRYLIGAARRIAGPVPAGFGLRSYPNPFNPVTTIEYELPERDFVSVRIYNMLGQQIVTLVEGERPAGLQRISWDASSLPSGIYMCRLESGGRSTTGRLLLLK